MKSLIRLSSCLVLAALISLPAFAQDRGPVEAATRPAVGKPDPSIDRDPIADFLHCMRILNLTDVQRTAIRQFVDGQVPTFQSLATTLAADIQTLTTDAAATPPNPCTVGADYLKIESDREAIRAEAGQIKDFIESQLSPEQRARFEGCLQRPGFGPIGTAK